MKTPFGAMMATQWGKRAGFLVGALATAGLILFCIQQVAILAFSAYGLFDENWAVQGERRSHVVMQARAQVIAVTGLATSRGPWSTYMDGPNVQVLIKGGTVKAIPRPTGLDLPQHINEPDSTVVVSGGIPEVRIRHLSKLCWTLLGKGNLARFALGALEYSPVGKEAWLSYDERFECPGNAVNEDAIRLRAAVASAQP